MTFGPKPQSNPFPNNYNVGQFSSIAFPIIRSVFADQVINDIVSVQPMFRDEPVSLKQLWRRHCEKEGLVDCSIYSLRYVYDK